LSFHERQEVRVKDAPPFRFPLTLPLPGMTV
jgi:hypothetical protein